VRSSILQSCCTNYEEHSKLTAIWDQLSWKASALSEKFDEFQAGKLKICITSIYESVKDNAEYQQLSFFTVSKENKRPSLIEALKKFVEIEKWTPEICKDLHWVLESLHNFDHTHDGHHTEQILIKRENKKHWDKMKDFHYDEFWKEEN